MALKKFIEKKQEEEVEEISLLPGPGEMLKAVREERGMSLEQVAASLNLRPSRLAELEAQIFDDKTSVTFIKGYFRSYAKLLEVSEQEVMEAFDKLNAAKQEPAKLQSFSRRVSKQASDDRLMFISYLIGAVVVAMVVIWWWQQSDSLDTSSFTGSSIFSSDTNSEPQIISVESVSSDAGQIKSNESATTSDQITQDRTSEVLPKQSSQPEVTDSVETETAPSIATGADVPADATDTIVSNESVETDAQSSANSEAQPEVTELPEASEPEVDLIATTPEVLIDDREAGDAEDLVIEFKSECWVNVTDATGEVLISGVKQPGHISSVQGVPPLSVALGVPRGVTVFYAGRPVDMSEFPAGRTARFELPQNN